MNSPEHGITSQEAKFTDYSDLLEQAKPKLDTYIESAEAIGDVWSYARKQHANPEKHVDLREVWGDLMNEYVLGEKDPRKRMLNAVVVEAPLQAARDEKLDILQAKISRENGDKNLLSREERDLLKNLTRGSVEYNHKLRRAILDTREMGLDRVKMTSLLSHSSGTEMSHPKWARDITTGVIAEVALYDGLQIMPQIDDPEFATVERDLQGTDIDAKIGRHKLGFDAKFDRPILELQWGLDGDYDAADITIGVPVEAIADMGLSKWGADYFKNKVGPRIEHFVSSKDNQ